MPGVRPGNWRPPVELSAACGSTPTSRSSPRCPTDGSSTSGMARTCQIVRVRGLTPGSSTSCSTTASEGLTDTVTRARGPDPRRCRSGPTAWPLRHRRPARTRPGAGRGSAKARIVSTSWAGVLSRRPVMRALPRPCAYRGSTKTNLGRGCRGLARCRRTVRGEPKLVAVPAARQDRFRVGGGEGAADVGVDVPGLLQPAFGTTCRCPTQPSSSNILPKRARSRP